MKCCVYFIFGNENSTQTMMRMMHAKSYYNNDVRFLCYIFIWYASKSMNSILNNANSFFVIVSTQLMRNRSIYARCSSHLIRQGMCVSTSLWFTKNRLWFEFNLYNFSLHPLNVSNPMRNTIEYFKLLKKVTTIKIKTNQIIIKIGYKDFQWTVKFKLFSYFKFQGHEKMKRIWLPGVRKMWRFLFQYSSDLFCKCFACIINWFPCCKDLA